MLWVYCDSVAQRQHVDRVSVLSRTTFKPAISSNLFNLGITVHPILTPSKLLQTKYGVHLLYPPLVPRTLPCRPPRQFPATQQSSFALDRGRSPEIGDATPGG